MTINLVRSPRGRIPDLANWSPNPRCINSANDYIAYDGGQNRPVVFAQNMSPFPGLGSVNGAYFDWTSNQNGNGGIYSPNAGLGTSGAGGQTVYLSMYVWCSKAQRLGITAAWQTGDGANPTQHLPASEQNVPAQTWTQLTAEVVPPANAVGCRTLVQGVFGVNSWGPGDRLIVTCHCQTIGQPVPGRYFDGDSAAFQDFTFSWMGTRGDSPSFRNIPDPATWITPDQLADRHQYSWLSRNMQHQLMNGNPATVLMQGTLRSGTLKVLFADRGKAIAAAKLLMTVGTWAFSDTDNPGTEFYFGVTGGQSVQLYQDDARSAWILEIPASEIPA